MDGEIAWKRTKEMMAKRYGWSWEYPDGLPYATVVEIIGMWIGEAKAHEKD